MNQRLNLRLSSELFTLSPIRITRKPVGFMQSCPPSRPEACGRHVDDIIRNYADDIRDDI